MVLDQIMNTYRFSFSDTTLEALPTGALWWPAAGTLVVSDLHLGKSERIARRGGALLPPYDVDETLGKLEDDLEATGPQTVICLGDSFDDLAAADELNPAHADWLTRLQARRRWIWVEGNHDPGPSGLRGSHLSEYARAPLVFRHIARPERPGTGEVSGHYHPKCGLSLRGGRKVSRACFLMDSQRLILPAYGAYTGGLRCQSPPLRDMMGRDAQAILTGRQPCAIPMPR